MRPASKLHTARTTTTGGREHGVARSSDGFLDIRLSSPGAARMGANPEQLFAAAWSASLESAIALVARRQEVALPPGLAIDAEVTLCLADGVYFLKARLGIRLPGLGRKEARAIVDEAHRTCAYSRATAGNVETTINVA